MHLPSSPLPSLGSRLGAVNRRRTVQDPHRPSPLPGSRLGAVNHHRTVQDPRGPSPLPGSFLHGSVVVDHHSKAVTRFPQIHPKLRMKCWCLLRNGAAPLRRGADLLGMYVLHVTLTLTLHLKSV